MVYEGLIMVAISAIVGGLKTAGTALGGFLKNNAGSISSFGGSLFSNATSKGAQARAFNYARQLQQHQYDLVQRGFLESPGNQRKGMESAGYNPMLALGNVGSSPAVAGGTPVSANATDTTGIRDAIMQKVSLQNQTKQTDATVENLDSSTRKNEAEAQGTLLHNKYIDDREKAEIANIQADTQQKSAVIENMKQTLEVYRMLGILDYNAKIYGANASSSAMRYGADKAYNASTYSADKNYGASTYASSLSHPWAKFGYKVWKDGEGPSRSRGNYPDPWK